MKNGWIVYTLSIDGKKDYATYNTVLWEILNSKLLKPSRHDNRLEFKVGYKYPYQKKPWYLSDLALACYKGYVTSLESCIPEMQRYFEVKGKKETEHMDSNTYNNTKQNLVWMEKGLNDTKSVKVTRIKEPNYLVSAYCDGEYRIWYAAILDAERGTEILRNMGYNYTAMDNRTMWYQCLCHSAEEYVQEIDLIIDKFAPKFANKLKDDRNKWIPTDGYVFRDTELSIRAQELLASLDRSEFMPVSIGKEESA